MSHLYGRNKQQTASLRITIVKMAAQSGNANWRQFVLAAISQQNADLTVSREQQAATTPESTNGSHSHAHPSPTRESSESTTTKPDTYTRKLATVRRIESLRPFSREQQIATFKGGWTVVVKTGKFMEGENVLFCEVDSFLPIIGPHGSVFAEVWNMKSFEGKNGYLVTTKFSINSEKTKVISQGHIFKLAAFPGIWPARQPFDTLHEDTPNSVGEDVHVDRDEKIDYAPQLGIVKYDPYPERTDQAPAIGPVPKFIIKADMERVQNCPNLFTKLKYKRFTFQESVKMDGRTMTCYFVPRTSRNYQLLARLPEGNHMMRSVHPNGRFGVCSRNQDLNSRSKSIYWDSAMNANLHVKLAKLGRSIAVQGELVGWDLQGNPHNYEKNQYEFFVFAVFDIDACNRWDPARVEVFARNHGLKHVPVLGYHKIPDIARNHEDLITRADMTSYEGLVFKNCADGRWFKVHSPRYLLRRGNEGNWSNPAPARVASPALVDYQAVSSPSTPSASVASPANLPVASTTDSSVVAVLGGWQANPQDMNPLFQAYRQADEMLATYPMFQAYMRDWHHAGASGASGFVSDPEQARIDQPNMWTWRNWLPPHEGGWNGGTIRLRV
ncbi:hypothetical protein B0H63DRAFT_103277, partial [Podospora didyma]